MLRLGTAMAACCLTLLVAAPAPAIAEFFGRDAVNEWMDNYRHRPQPMRLPDALITLSRSMTFKDPENAGFYVGFAAGVLGANPARAEALIARMTALPPADRWVVVRAIAYSGLPQWRALMIKFAPRMPERREMIEEYLAGRLPTLDAIMPEGKPGFFERLKASLSGERKERAPSFAGNPELLDTLWGQYFATGSALPVRRILTLLPWSKDRDDVERLTVGSFAKVTLANNASRYPDLLRLIKTMKPRQSEEVRTILSEVIEAAETMDGPRLRKQAREAIEEIRRKGPGYKRDVVRWGQIGQGALALGCIAAAAASMTALGLPCVVGGALTSAGLYYWSQQ